MSNNQHTFSSYLGPEFQQHLIWQLLVDYEFADRIFPDLSIDYFDDPNIKRFFMIITDYQGEFEKMPNLYNDTIRIAINKYKLPNNVIEEESLFAILERITLWDKNVSDNKLQSSGDVIQKEVTSFIKQQEYRKLGEYILTETRSGKIRSKNTIGILEDMINKISRIGDTEDMGSEVTEGIDNALSEEFRETIRTGIDVIDGLTGGGLGKGEIGLILTASGVGKTTALTVISNTAYNEGENVLQIIFEDTPDQIKRKHYTIWTGVPLNEVTSRAAEVKEKITTYIENKKRGGRLVIKKFSQENTTMVHIRDWIARYEKIHGFKFTLLTLDYLDCLESHKKVSDRNEAELVIVKSFLALADDLNIPSWSALQSNRGGFDADIVEVQQMGGNVKRVQKAHFFMSVAKPNEMRDGNLANVKIIKARFAKDGQVFKDSIFDNNTMQITLNDSSYDNKYSKMMRVKSTEEQVSNLNGIVGSYEDNSFINVKTENNNNDMLKRLQANKAAELIKPNLPEFDEDIVDAPVKKVDYTSEVFEIIPADDDIETEDVSEIMVEPIKKCALDRSYEIENISNDMTTTEIENIFDDPDSVEYE